ncbi:MAG: hypothetical protein ABI199_09780 [Bacteroidia bacterium]
MYKKIIFLGLFITCIGKLKSQVVYVDPNLIRGDISFTQMNLKFEGIPVRKAIGLHTKVGGRIISVRFSFAAKNIGI